MAGSPLSQDATCDELVRRSIAGDPEGQRLLFRRESRTVHATLFRILGTNSDIEDLIQEAFIQVFRSLPTFRGEASLATWIGRITTRVAFAHIRRRKKSRELMVPSTGAMAVAEDERTTTPLEMLETKRAVAALYAVLDELDAKFRIPYALAVIDGRSLAEVASLTGASVTATKSRVSRARTQVNRRARRDPHLASYLQAQGVGGP